MDTNNKLGVARDVVVLVSVKEVRKLRPLGILRTPDVSFECVSRLRLMRHFLVPCMVY